MLNENGKYIFGVCKVNEKGQIVIPKEVREMYNINAGDGLLILGDSKGIALIKTEIFSSLAEQVLEDK